jgi:hypothetical protein
VPYAYVANPAGSAEEWREWLLPRHLLPPSARSSSALLILERPRMLRFLASS